MERVYDMYWADGILYCLFIIFGANVAESVWIDLMQEIRPYTIIFVHGY